MRSCLTWYNLSDNLLFNLSGYLLSIFFPLPTFRDADILPIRPGHLLVIPKLHYARVSHLPDEVSANLGRVLPRISRAMCRALDQPDYNIVSNQGYAQVSFFTFLPFFHLPHENLPTSILSKIVHHVRLTFLQYGPVP